MISIVKKDSVGFSDSIKLHINFSFSIGFVAVLLIFLFAHISSKGQLFGQKKFLLLMIIFDRYFLPLYTEFDTIQCQ